MQEERLAELGAELLSVAVLLAAVLLLTKGLGLVRDLQSLLGAFVRRLFNLDLRSVGTPQLPEPPPNSLESQNEDTSESDTPSPVTRRRSSRGSGLANMQSAN